jgi:hypothetical protein
MSIALNSLYNGDTNTINQQREEEKKKLAKYKVAEQTSGGP